MQVNTIVVGQGLCGTWLSYWLRQAGHSFLLIDEYRPDSASQVASGVINPVTGRSLANTWMAEILLPFAMEAYTAIGAITGINCIHSSEILHCFPSRQMEDAFKKKLPALPEYLANVEDTNHWHSMLHFHYGLGAIRPALLINLQALLAGWRQLLTNEHLLLAEKFNIDQMKLTADGVQYGGIAAERIIFCNGLSAMDYRYFDRLPFSPNKGEALLLEIDALPADRIYKKGISLVPFPYYGKQANDRIFWAGSTYENEFVVNGPTLGFRTAVEATLKDWLKPSFQIIDHLAAIRPATVERRPFVGMHPWFPRIGLLNGMGTKGCSLAPWFGKQLADHIVDAQPIQPEASLDRFSRLLQP